MDGSFPFLLAASFLVEVAAMFVLVRAIAKDQFGGAEAARTIFHPQEIGHAEDPAAADTQAIRASGPLPDDPSLREELRDRAEADQSSREPVLWFLGSGVVWLIVGSILGLVAALELNLPDLVSGSAALTFGRLRPVHLNAIAYGWLSMAEVGVALWLVPRLVRHPLVGGRWAVIGAMLWNAGVFLGLGAILSGWTDGTEWLEIPWQIDGLFVVGGALAGVPLFQTLRKARVHHAYVSVWYITAAFLWFPFLFLVANAPLGHFGVEHAAVNWWFAHNVLGLWFTPIALGATYYLIPKIIGRPIHSYQLSLLGFWGLALFYSHVGIHHLIGGPVPSWLVTVSVVTSVMMFVPVLTVGVNHHFTMRGHFGALRSSPTLRFVVLGAITYTLTSLEGSLQALRTVNQLTHFTHFTVGHAHMGAYGFVSFVVFGASYFLLPRLVGREWPWPRLVSWHFWLAFVGITVYVGALSVGGILQGLAMLDPARPFSESVTVAAPWLWLRTVGGTLMTVSHLLFGAHALALVLRVGPVRVAAPWQVPDLQVATALEAR